MISMFAFLSGEPGNEAESHAVLLVHIVLMYILLIDCHFAQWYSLNPCVSSLLFPSAQIKVFLEGLFHLNNDIPVFKEHLRDFLVQIKVSRGP